MEKILKQTKGWKILKGEAFDNDFISYVISEDGQRIHEFLNKCDSSIKETDTTYRTINHWDSEGLMNIKREGGKSWRKFSIVDIIWVYILGELRSFGFSIEKLKRVKACVLSHEGKSVTLLEFYIAQILAKKEPSECFIVVDNCGYADVGTRSEVEATESVLLFPDSLVTVRLNPLVARVAKDLKSNREPSVALTKSEFEALKQIRNGDFDVVTIKLKNGGIKLIESTKAISVVDRDKSWEIVKEIIKNAEFQDIEIKTENGKVVSIISTIKDKML